MTTPGTRLDRLFYEIEVRGEGAAKQLSVVETAGKRFAAAMKAHPVAMAGVLTTTLAAVALKAAEMADAVNKSMRITVQQMPQLRTQLGLLREAVESISVSSGKSQVEISEYFAVAAKTGVTSFAELNGVVTTAMKLARSTGEDVTTLIGALDQAMDTFQLSAREVEALGAKLFAFTQGRAGVAELTDSFRTLVPVFDRAGISFEVGANALARLIGDRGMGTRAAAGELTKMAARGEEGAAAIRELAGEILTTEEAQRKWNEAVAHGLVSLEKSHAVIKEQFNAEMIRLGQVVLPLVTKGLSFAAVALKDFLDLLTGRDPNAPKASDMLPELSDSKEKVEARLKFLKDGLAAQKELLRLGSQMQTTYKTVKTGDATVTVPVEVTKEASAVLKQYRDNITATELAIQATRDMLASFDENPIQTGGGGLENRATLLKDIAAASKSAKDAYADFQNSAAITMAGYRSDFEAGLLSVQAANAKVVAGLREQLTVLDELAREAGPKAGIAPQLAAARAEIEAAIEGATTLGAALETAFSDDHAAKQAAEDRKALREATDALAVSELRRQGKHEEATQLELRQRREIAAEAVRELAAADKISNAARDQLLATLEQTAANEDAAGLEAKLAAIREESATLAQDNAIAELAAAGKIWEARRQAILLEQEAYELAIAREEASAGTTLTDEQRAENQLRIAQRRRATEIALAAELKGQQAEIQQHQEAFTSELFRTAAAATDLLVAIGKVPGAMGEAFKASLGLVENIQRAVDAMEQLGAAKSSVDVLAGLTGVIGGVTAVASAIKGLLGSGPSPEELAQGRRTEQNTAAIDRLTSTINSFGDVTLSGSAFAGLREALDPARLIADLGPAIQRAFDAFDPRHPQRTFEEGGSLDRAVLDYLSSLGITLDQVREAAAGVGIELSDGIPSLQDLEELGKALRAQEFNRYATTFTGQLDKITRGFRMLGTDGAGQFQELVELLTDPTFGAPALFDALRGIDVSTADGAAEAMQVIRDLFQGFESFAPEAFGSLNPQQFFDILQQLLGTLPTFEAGVSEVTLLLMDLEEGFRVFGTSSRDQVRAFLDTVDDFVPGMAALLEGLDLTSVSGMEQARDRLVDFYTQVKSGAIELSDEAFRLLLESIERLNTEVPRVAETLGRLMASLFEEFDAFGIVDPVEQLALVFAKLGDIAPEIAEALEGIDLTTAEGLRQADEALAALFLAARNGGIDLPTDDILRFQDLIREALRRIVDDAEDMERSLQRAVEEENRAREREAEAARRASEEARRAAEALAEAAERAAAAAEAARVATGARALGQLRDEFSLFDIEEPVDQLRQLLGVLSAGSGGLFDRLLGDLNVQDIADRTEMLERLQEFFLANPQGVDAGYFDSDAIRQQTLALAELIKATNAADVTTGQATSFQIDRSISVAEGNQMIGYLGSIAADASAIRALLAIPANQTIVPPPVGTFTPAAAIMAASGLAAESPSSTSVGPIIINVTTEGVSSPVTISALTSRDVRDLMTRIAQEVALRRHSG